MIIMAINGIDRRIRKTIIIVLVISLLVNEWRKVFVCEYVVILKTKKCKLFVCGTYIWSTREVPCGKSSRVPSLS